MALDPAAPLVQLVLLHPVVAAAAAAASDEAAAAIPELAPLCARLRSLHPGARLRIAHVAYTDGLLAPGSTGAWRDEPVAGAPPLALQRPAEAGDDEWSMHLDGAPGSAAAKAHVLTGLGAAIEKLAPAPEAYSPMLPPPPSVAARLILHLAAPLSLSFEPVPRAGFSSSQPWDISSVAAALKEHSIHFSTLLRPAPGDGSFDDARKLHTSVSPTEDMPAADVTSLLSTSANGNALLRGFAPSRSGVPPPPAPAPAAPAPPAAGAAPNKMTLPASIVQDPQARIALQKLMFVQTHFQNIAKSANAALEAMSAAGNPDPVRRKGLEKIKSDVRTALEQVHAQAKIVTTGAAIPDSTMFFGLLSVLHRDAENCNISSGVSEAVLKIARQAAEAAKTQMQQAAASNAAPKPAVATAPGPVPGGQQAPAAPQQTQPGSGPASVWSGSICWTITDATQTKREVSTMVSANVSAKTPRDALVLPWPARLTIAQVSSLDLASLHSYVAAHQVPAILFATKQAVAGEPPVPPANERIYTTLANMLRERKSCAFIPHGAPGAGIVLVATPVSAPGTPSPPRLLGLVFKDQVPLAQMALVAQQRAQAAQQAQAAPAASGAPTTSVAPPPPPAAAPLSVSIPPASQPTPALGAAPGSAAPPQALFQAQATPPAPTQPVSLQAAQQYAMQRQLAANLMRQRAGAGAAPAPGAVGGMSSPTAANNPMQQAQALAHTQFMHAQAQQAAQAVARQMQAQQMRAGQPQPPQQQQQQAQQPQLQQPPPLQQQQPQLQQPQQQQQLWGNLGGFDLSQASAPQQPQLNTAFLNAFNFDPNAGQPQMQMQQPGMGQANMVPQAGAQGWNMPGSAPGMPNMGGAGGVGGISAAEAAALAQQLGLSVDALKPPPQQQQGQMQGGMGGMPQMMQQQPGGGPMAPQQPQGWGAPGAFGVPQNLGDAGSDFALLQQMLGGGGGQPR